MAEITRVDLILAGIDVDSLENFEQARWDPPETEQDDVYNQPQEWDK